MDGDDEYPTICGTGTEDYFCGAYNFDPGTGYVAFTAPYAGMPCVSKPDGLYNACQRFGLYRWHIVDPIYFKKDIRITIQALSDRPRIDDISSVAYWYQNGICKTFPRLPDKDYLEII